jgi:hypothetical protein
MTNRSFVLVTALASGLPALPGCLFGGDGGPPRVEACGDAYEIDTGATVSHTAGVDAGYYISYGSGGFWHLDWTCDTKLSAIGCEFEGTITSPSLANADCFMCESDDQLNASPGEVSWITQTSTGLDGTDFTTNPGETIHLDLSINNIPQPDYVFIPSEGNVASPDCNPMDLTPNAP